MNSKKWFGVLLLPLMSVMLMTVSGCHKKQKISGVDSETADTATGDTATVDTITTDALECDPGWNLNLQGTACVESPVLMQITAGAGHNCGLRADHRLVFKPKSPPL